MPSLTLNTTGGRRGSDAGSTASSGSDCDDDDAGGYYGTPLSHSNLTQEMDPEAVATLRPPLRTVTPGDKLRTDSMDSTASRDSSRTSSTSTLADVRRAIETEKQQDDNATWDDDLLDEVGHIGEGAGGAVFKVAHRVTGLVMAKKTIPATHSTPARQLIRELSFLANCVHENIVKFYGAFMSAPNSEHGAEVCLLMEYCEGGSRSSLILEQYQLILLH